MAQAYEFIRFVVVAYNEDTDERLGIVSEPIALATMAHDLQITMTRESIKEDYGIYYRVESITVTRVI